MRTSRLSVVVAAGLLAACQREGILDPQGPISTAERLILLNATGIMLVVVVPVIILTLTFAWWYRASNSRARYDAEWSYSGRIELVVWSIPAMVVILLASVGWTGSHLLDPAHQLDSATGGRSASRAYPSIGNGCSSIPIRASPRSISS